MRVFILWDEDCHVAKLCLSMESAVAYIKDRHEAGSVEQSRHGDAKTADGRWLYDLDLEAGGARYRLEEMEAE